MQMPRFLKPLDLQEQKNAILKDFAAACEQKGILYTPLEADDYSLLVSCIITRLNLHITRINYTIAQNYLPYSSGEYLDALVELLGLKRLQGSKPNAKAKIITKKALFLPKGTRFVSSSGVAASTMLDYDLKQGENEIILIAPEQGAHDTSTPELANNLIEKVEVLSAFVTTQLEENDEELRIRFKNALAKFSTAGSKAAYEYYASVAANGKTLAFCANPGVVKVLYTSDDPNAKELITQALEKNVPLTDKVIVEKAKSVGIDLEIRLQLSKDTADFNTITHNIKQKIKDFFQTLEIGQNASANKLISVCFEEGVLDANVQGLRNIAEDEFLFLRDVNISAI